MKNAKLLIAAFCLMIFVMAEAASAATYYVAKTGNDANPGTESQPWKTITKAANTAVAGDTVYVKEGTYNERLIVKNSGTSGNWITFSAAPGTARDTVIIDGTGITIPSLEGLVYINGKSYIKISGFKVQYANEAGVMITGKAAAWSNITIEKVHTYDTSSSGIDALGSGNNLIIDQNDVELHGHTPYGRWSQEALSVSSGMGGVNGIIISNNRVHHNAYWYFPSSNTYYGQEGLTVKDGSTNAKIFGNEVDHMSNVDDWNTGIYIGCVT